jgi:hypothetical protein
LRVLAADYGVAHTTPGRYFARPEVARQLRQAGHGVRAERRAAAAWRACGVSKPAFRLQILISRDAN